MHEVLFTVELTTKICKNLRYAVFYSQYSVCNDIINMVLRFVERIKLPFLLLNFELWGI